MSDKQTAIDLVGDGRGQLTPKESLDLMSVHANIPAALNLFERAYEADDHDGMDRYLGFLTTLTAKHRTLHIIK